MTKITTSSQSRTESGEAAEGAFREVLESTERPSRFRLPIVAAALAALAWLWMGTVSPEEQAVLWRTYRVLTFLMDLSLTYLVICCLYIHLGSGRRRLRLFRVVVLTLSLASILALVELPAIVFRHNFEETFHTGPMNTWLQLSSHVNKPDPELIHIHWPHSSYRASVVGNLVLAGAPSPAHYLVDVRYDEHGFRNETDLKQADVVVIGDSFIEAALMPLDDTVVKQLEHRLGKTTANLGQAAYGLKQELVVLKRYGLALSPKLVFWFFFGGNDLRDVETYEWQREHFEELLGPRPLRNRLFTRNALLALSRLTTPARTEPPPMMRKKSGLFTRADHTTQRVYFGQTNGPWSSHDWEVATATLREADRLCRGAGAKLIVVYIPRKFRVYRKYMAFSPDSLPAHWGVNDLPRTLGRWCAGQGIGYVDTTASLERVLAQGEHAYFPDDVHWNAKGHAVAATVVADDLARRGWTSPRKSDGNASGNRP